MKPETTKPPSPEAATPADVITPHDAAAPGSAGGDEPVTGPGIIDPRQLPGPEILQPPPPGLPKPTG
jgi:hypothetical protein